MFWGKSDRFDPYAAIAQESLNAAQYEMEREARRARIEEAERAFEKTLEPLAETFVVQRGSRGMWHVLRRSQYVTHEYDRHADSPLGVTSFGRKREHVEECRNAPLPTVFAKRNDWPLATPFLHEEDARAWLQQYIADLDACRTEIRFDQKGEEIEDGDPDLEPAKRMMV